MLKEYLIALSLANLCFYNVILAFFYKGKFYQKILPGTNQLLALIVNELFIAALFWLAWRLVKRVNKKYLINFAKFILCLLVLIFIYDLARDFKNYFNIKLFRVCLLILLIVLIILKKTTRVATSFLLLVAPFVGIVFLQSFQGVVTDLTNKTTSVINKPIFPRQDNTPRVLWLVYDELDYRIPFVDRPNDLKMPAFDELLQQSLSAKNAYSPSGETITSLPGLIDGKRYSEADICGPSELKLISNDRKNTVKWGSQPNLFSKASELKFNTAFVGEYMPYSRLIGKDLTFCEWYQYYPQYTSPGSVFANMYQQIKMLIIGPARHYMQRKNSYSDVQNLTKNLVANPNYNIIMIHNPIPHYPFFYQQPFWDDRSPEGYINALKLVDLSLGEIRQVMEEEGIWDNTTLIVSADHWLRVRFDGKDETRVPFIVKLTQQKEPVTYEPAFNTVITQELILKILHGEVSSPGELIEFLHQNTGMITPVKQP